MSRLRRLRRPAGDLSRARRDRATRPRDRVHLRHRLLVAHPRLHDGLRVQQRARPRAADRTGLEARASRAAGPRRRRRRRRLLDRRRTRAARGAAERRPHVHRDGQPDLRTHQGAAVADGPAGAAHGHLRVRQPRAPRESAPLRARVRRRVRRAGLARGHRRAHRDDRGRDPLPGLRVRERAVAVRDVRGREPADQSPQGRHEEARGPRPRPDEPEPGARACAVLRQRAPDGRLLLRSGPAADTRRARARASGEDDGGGEAARAQILDMFVQH